MRIPCVPGPFSSPQASKGLGTGGGGGGGGGVQNEVMRSRRNIEAGQAVKLEIGGSLRTVKVPPGDRWAWLMLDSQGSRPDFWCSQGVKHENLLGQDLDCGRGWKYSSLSQPRQ